MTAARRLLVVDDDAAMRQMLVSLFREQGYQVEEAPARRGGLGVRGGFRI